MNETAIKLAIDGLKGVQGAHESKAKALESTINALETMMNDIKTDCLKDIAIATITKRYAGFMVNNEKHFENIDYSERLFIATILENI